MTPFPLFETHSPNSPCSSAPIFVPPSDRANKKTYVSDSPSCLMLFHISLCGMLNGILGENKPIINNLKKLHPKDSLILLWIVLICLNNSKY